MILKVRLLNHLKNEIKSFDFKHSGKNLKYKQLESKPKSKQELPEETIAERVKLKR